MKVYIIDYDKLREAYNQKGCAGQLAEAMSFSIRTAYALYSQKHNICAILQFTIYPGDNWHMWYIYYGHLSGGGFLSTGLSSFRYAGDAASAAVDALDEWIKSKKPGCGAEYTYFENGSDRTAILMDYASTVGVSVSKGAKAEEGGPANDGAGVLGLYFDKYFGNAGKRRGASVTA